MQELPELENSELKDLIGAIALIIYNRSKGGYSRGSSFAFYPSTIFLGKLKDTIFASDKRFIIFRIPKGEKVKCIEESVKSFLESKQKEFGEVIEKLFEDAYGNKTIDVEISHSDKLRYKIVYVGDIEAAKIIKYIKDRIS